MAARATALWEGLTTTPFAWSKHDSKAAAAAALHACQKAIFCPLTRSPRPPHTRPSSLHTYVTTAGRQGVPTPRRSDHSQASTTCIVISSRWAAGPPSAPAAAYHHLHPDVSRPIDLSTSHG